MTQLALSHTADPSSSHEAAVRSNAQAHRRVVVAKLKEAPGMTGAELASLLPFDVYETRRRLSDALRFGEARQGVVRQCRIAGTSAVEWWPA